MAKNVFKIAGRFLKTGKSGATKALKNVPDNFIPTKWDNIFFNTKLNRIVDNTGTIVPEKVFGGNLISSHGKAKVTRAGKSMAQKRHIAPTKNIGLSAGMSYNDVHTANNVAKMSGYDSFVDSFNKATTTAPSVHMDALPSAHAPIKQKTGFAGLVADGRTRAQYNPNRGTSHGTKREIGYGTHKRTVHDGLVKPTGNTKPKSPTNPGTDKKSLWQQFKDAKGPQMALGALGLGYVASQMSANKGQQSNAQLYGQQRGYY